MSTYTLDTDEMLAKIKEGRDLLVASSRWSDAAGNMGRVALVMLVGWSWCLWRGPRDFASMFSMFTCTSLFLMMVFTRLSSVYATRSMATIRSVHEALFPMPPEKPQVIE